MQKWLDLAGTPTQHTWYIYLNQKKHNIKCKSNLALIEIEKNTSELKQATTKSLDIKNNQTTL